MVGWHHRLDGHEFEQVPGVGDGKGGLACCDSWGCKESDMTEQLPLSPFDKREDLVMNDRKRDSFGIPSETEKAEMLQSIKSEFP